MSFEIASGAELDTIGFFLANIERCEGESDSIFRSRIKGTLLSSTPLEPPIKKKDSNGNYVDHYPMSHYENRANKVRKSLDDAAEKISSKPEPSPAKQYNSYPTYEVVCHPDEPWLSKVRQWFQVK